MHTFLIAVKYVAIDLVGDFFYFPLWWYSVGIKKAANWCARNIRELEGNLALRIWLKNIFVPMYAQYDIEGRIVSFIIRFFQIIFRSLALLVGVIFILLFFLLWILVPVIVAGQIFMILSLIVINYN